MKCFLKPFDRIFCSVSDLLFLKDEIENATDEPTLGLRGVFISPNNGQDTARIDTGSSSITDKFSWLKNRHKWDWWQKARQPRQPWQSSSRRRKRRRRRLVNLN